MEQTTVELLLEYARTHSDPRIQRHVERGVRQVTNLNTQRLIDLVGTLDPAWRSELEKFIVDEYKDALDGIVALRNSVAHGRYVGVTLSRASDYYKRAKKLRCSVSMQRVHQSLLQMETSTGKHSPSPSRDFSLNATSCPRTT